MSWLQHSFRPVIFTSMFVLTLVGTTRGLDVWPFIFPASGDVAGVWAKTYIRDPIRPAHISPLRSFATLVFASSRIYADGYSPALSESMTLCDDSGRSCLSQLSTT